MFKREYICDICFGRASAVYSGEHWLPPPGWAQLKNCETETNHDIHLCGLCITDLESHRLQKKPGRPKGKKK